MIKMLYLYYEEKSIEDKKSRYSNIDITKWFGNNDQNNLYHFLLQNCCHTKICGAS